MRTKFRIKTLLEAVLIAFLASLTFCQFGEGDAMDSYRGSGDPLFVAVASDGFSYVSEDGKNWRKGGDTIVNRYSVIYANGSFWAVGADKNVLSSPDGIYWVITSTINESSGNILFADDKYIVSPLASSNLEYSYNGIYWNTVTYDTPPLSSLEKLSNGNGIFFGLDTNNSDVNIYTSHNGIHWIEGSKVNSAFSSNSVAYGNTIFVIIGDDGANGQIYISQDSVSWSENVAPSNTKAINDITYGNRTFVAVTSDGKAVVSKNGFIWDGPIDIPGAGVTDFLQQVIFSDGIYIAVGNNGTIVYSEDGYNWSGNVGPGGAIIINDIAVRP